MHSKQHHVGAGILQRLRVALHLLGGSLLAALYAESAGLVD